MVIILQFITIYYNLLQFITIYYNLLQFIINYKPNYSWPSLNLNPVTLSHTRVSCSWCLSNPSTDLSKSPQGDR